MVTPVSKIWMDGKMVNWDDARVHVLTHTLHYGLGVFEGIRFYQTPEGPGIFRLPDHLCAGRDARVTSRPPIAGLPVFTTSAVNGYGFSGHIVGQIGRQKLDYLGTVFDGSGPSKGDPFQAFPAWGVSAGMDQTRCYAVDRDIVGAQFLSQCAGVIDDGRFSGSVWVVESSGIDARTR